MKRRILIVASLFVAHFVASVVLSVLVYLSMFGSFVGAPSSASDRIIAWVLMVLLFPVRNLVNLFVAHPDSRLRDFSGWFVIAAASLLWSGTIYYSVTRLKSLRHAA
jgi:hypothetical protein